MSRSASVAELKVAVWGNSGTSRRDKMSATMLCLAGVLEDSIDHDPGEDRGHSVL